METALKPAGSDWALHYEVVAALVLLLALFAVTELLDRLDRRRASKEGVQSEPRQETEIPSDLPWEELLKRAGETIQRTIATLPSDLRVEADALPFVLKKWAPTKSPVRTLGRYIGFEHGRRSEYIGPIILYLGAIQEFCADNGLDFEHEVRTTYLHEFGHHLGWNEDEIAKRGLA